MKPSAVSSLLVPSNPLRLASDSLNAKPHARMDSFPFSLPHLHADPHTAWFLRKRNAWEERPGVLLLPMPMQIMMNDVATQQKPKYEDFLTSLLVRLKAGLFV